ncbi:TrkH family potassium uptake protein [Millionella massiliensis]|uniref:TrkH family potassium uptake protein n=1 Tax=Millionella massiliensis TaxID=1871023 RepID=UPI0023A8E9EC|nr:potassium transporter TrkG [Millionella massiliensis]
MKQSVDNLLSRLRLWVLRGVEILILLISIVAPCGVVYMFGFPQTPVTLRYLEAGYQSLLILMWLAMTFRILLGDTSSDNNTRLNKRNRSILFGAYVVLTLIAIFNLALRYHWLAHDAFLNTVSAPWAVIATLLIVSFLELARAVSGLLTRRVNPSSILAGSFLLIILVGSGLLMLPNCTYRGISYVDSLFTAASAVCVTGLSSVSVADTFTTTGQTVILILIQIGGLGIMTITSFFSLFFMGQTSLKSQLQLGDLFSSDTMGGLGRTLVKIIAVTFSVEALGALLLYGVVEGQPGFETGGRTLFFSVFHSVSAFCNAGFSTLPGNLYDPAVRHLWEVPMIISWLVIFGGIGFPIFSNILSVVGRKLKNLLRFLRRRPLVRYPHQLSLNSYIVLRTTVILILGSWVYMLAAEWNHSLAEFSLVEKLSQGFLAAVTPRTAGFNGVDMNRMLPATLILTMVLMWIGGAPQSTAGGIKVTTFYLMFRNVVATLRGTSTIHVHKREIPANSVRRAFAVVGASLGILVVGVMLLVLLEPGVEVSKLAFEAVAALGTAGLSLGITPELGTGAKLVLIVMMFAGRVGIIGVLMAVVRPQPSQPYSYPHDDILIN